jgi:hypothetical protein
MATKEIDDSRVYKHFLKHAATVLYELGFNTIPVDANKKPLTSWSADKRLDWEELERLLKRASGVAITGRYLDSPDYGIVIFDLDNVPKADEILSRAIGDWRTRLCGQGWSLCGLTGPRPKGKVTCNCKSPGEDCECTIQDTGERKKLSELERGMYIIVRVNKNCIPGGTIRGDAIEVMVNNYEVVYGKHPSGVYYQPVAWNGNQWIPVDIENVGQGEIITCDELNKIISELTRSGTTNETTPAGAATTELPEPTRELNEEKINTLVNLLTPVWQVKDDAGKNYHDRLLFGITSLMRRAGIKYEVAKRVVEAIIEAGVRAVMSGADEDAIKHEIEVEKREHIRETVEHVYSENHRKPDINIWGRQAFEEALTPAVEKAISQGLLSNFTNPSEWFNTIYNIIYGEKRRGRHGAVDARDAGLASNIDTLSEYLPTEDGVVSVPPWAVKLKMPMIEYCLSTPICRRSLVTYTREGSQYVVFAIKTIETIEDEESDEKIDIDNYTPIAVLPRFMGQVYDTYYREWSIVAVFDGRIIATASDFDEFINTLVKMAGYKFYATENKQLLGIIRSLMPSVKMIVSPGITDDGFVDPAGVLDLTDYGVKPLLNAYEWIRKYYPEANAMFAWFNVLAAVAKVLTPLIRYHNKTFNDMIVYNRGDGGEGKSTLVRYVLTPMLGGDEAKEAYYIVLDGSIKSDAQLRNLLSLNRLPLVLDEQNKDALKRNVGIFISAAIGAGMIGIHAAKYGHGIAVKFKNLRGMIVFTNVLFDTFLNEVMEEASDYAIVRRFIVIQWDPEPINKRAFSDLPQVRPVYGFVARLWREYRDVLIEASDLIDLIDKLTVAIAREIARENEALADEVYDFTMEVLSVIRQLSEEKKADVKDPTNELIKNAYNFVTEHLGVTNPTAVRVLRYILENQYQASAVLTGTKEKQKADELLKELYSVMSKLAEIYGIAEDGNRVIGTDNDAVIVYSILKNALNNRKVYIALLANGPLVRGSPRAFLGVEKTNVSINGKVHKGYYIPLATFVRLFLARASEEENEEASSEEQTEETGNEEQTPENTSEVNTQELNGEGMGGSSENVN